MADMEKVIKESEEAIDILAKAEEPTFLLEFVRCAFENALALLKEQQVVIAQLRNDANARRCEYCRHRDPEDKKCDNGHDIKWQLPRPDNWFCADFDPSDEAVLEAFAEDG